MSRRPDVPPGALPATASRTAPRHRLGAVLPALLVVLAACGSLRPASHSTTAPATAPPSASSPQPSPGRPWGLPAGEASTQSLFRVTYDGPEGEGSFRLTLLLVDPERYQARAVDPLGRALWTLDSAAGRGLWIDHRNHLACPLDGRFDVAAARLVPVPLSALPALLLGGVPAAPAGEPRRRGDRLSWRDGDDRRWTARLAADGTVAAWTLWLDGAPVVWWQRARDGRALLSDRRRGTQLRWRRVIEEPLPAAPQPAVVPEGYDLVSCAAAYDP